MGVKRVNITLPEDVIEILNKKSKDGEKSSYIAEAVREYSKNKSRQTLIREMIKGYQTTAEEDIKLSEEWDSTLVDE